jgi:dTMP kinase
MTRGRFIVLEGGEGAGKSSVQRALGARLQADGRLRDDGIDVLLTREPGGTPLGERIRELVLAQREVGDPLTELLLFEAARAHLVATVIRPALNRGAIVLCDRFAASSVAYQGFGRGLGRDVVERANAIATGGLTPDLTLLLDIPSDDGLARRSKDGAANHFDAAELAFHERVRAGFLELAHESPATWRIIDASQPLDTVVDAAYREVVTLTGGSP